MDDLRRIMLYGAPVIALLFALSATATAAPQGDAANELSEQAAASTPVGSDVRVSRVIGATVVSREGRIIGKIEDLLVDARNGTVEYAVLRADSGVATASERLLRLPVASLRQGGGAGNQLVLEASDVELESFRTFRRAEWPAWHPGMDLAAATAPARKGSDTPSVRGRQYQRASALLDAELKDRSGAKVGEVRDVVVNLRQGRLRYGVAEFDTSWFERGKWVVVPLREVRDEGDDGRDLVMNVERDALRAAPSFDRDHWPRADDRDFQRRIDTHIASR